MSQREEDGEGERRFYNVLTGGCKTNPWERNKEMEVVTKQRGIRGSGVWFLIS
jgi:hypothetical protein